MPEGRPIGAGTTICIPTYQRREGVVRLLGSIADACTGVATGLLPAGVVVCVDGSTDGTEEALRTLARDYPLPLACIHQENRGLAAARNACMRGARTDRLWFLDDDMLVSSSAVVAHCRMHAGRGALVMGPCDIPEDAESYSRVARDFYEPTYAALARSGRVDDPMHFSCANTSGPAATFLDVGFDETFTRYGFEDFEFALRALTRGTTILYAAEASVRHEHHMDWRGFLGTLRGMAQGRVIFHRRHPEVPVEALPAFTARGRGVVLLYPLAVPIMARPLWLAARLAGAVVDRYDGPFSANLWNFARTAATCTGIAEVDGRSLFMDAVSRRTRRD